MKSSRISSTNWFDNCPTGGAWALFELREAPFYLYYGDNWVQFFAGCQSINVRIFAINHPTSLHLNN